MLSPRNLRIIGLFAVLLLTGCGGGSSSSSPKYTLSGTISPDTNSDAWVKGVTVTLSGDGSGTTTTDASGNYSFSNLPAGNYTVTPSLPGYDYNPASSSVTIGSADATVSNIMASSAVTTSTVSGTISYSGASTGDLYIQVRDASCTNYCIAYAETHIAAASVSSSTSFTLHGVPSTGGADGTTPAQYVLYAYMDTMDTGIDNASDPSGSSGSFTVNSGDMTTENITLSDPSAFTLTAPTDFSVVPGNGSAVIDYQPPEDSAGRELATSYELDWGTGSNYSGSGSETGLTANGDIASIVFVPGLADGTAYNFQLCAKASGQTTQCVQTSSAVTIGAATGNHSISGQVTFSATASGSLYVVAIDFADGNAYFERFDTPSSSPVSYTITGVPDGDYQVYAFIDQNNDHIVDSGDIDDLHSSFFARTINMNGSDLTGVDVPLNSASSKAVVRTNHIYDVDTSSLDYTVKLLDYSGAKRAVAATVVSGPHIAVPYDLGVDPETGDFWRWFGTTSPTVGDTYQFHVTYADGTDEVISGTVQTVANYFVSDFSTSGDSSGGVPTFNWVAPVVSVPTYYGYNVGVSSDITTSLDDMWHYPRDHHQMSSATTSVQYNVDGQGETLSAGSMYDLLVAVCNTNGDCATKVGDFTKQ